MILGLPIGTISREWRTEKRWTTRQKQRSYFPITVLCSSVINALATKVCPPSAKQHDDDDRGRVLLTDRIHRIPMFCTWAQQYHDIGWCYPTGNEFGSTRDRRIVLVLKRISPVGDCSSPYYLMSKMRWNVGAFERDDWRHGCVGKTKSRWIEQKDEVND